MIEDVTSFLEKLEADEQLFQVLARVLRKFKTDLVNEGFTEEQAIQIIASQGVGCSFKQ